MRRRSPNPSITSARASNEAERSFDRHFQPPRRGWPMGQPLFRLGRSGSKGDDVTACRAKVVPLLRFDLRPARRRRYGEAVARFRWGRPEDRTRLDTARLPLDLQLAGGRMARPSLLSLLHPILRGPSSEMGVFVRGWPAVGRSARGSPEHAPVRAVKRRGRERGFHIGLKMERVRGTNDQPAARVRNTPRSTGSSRVNVAPRPGPSLVH